MLHSGMVVAAEGTPGVDPHPPSFEFEDMLII